MVYRRQVLKPIRTLRRNPARYIINELPKTYNDKVYPKIPFLIRSKAYNIKASEDLGNSPDTGQLKNLAFSVTELFKKERIVLNYNRGTEVRNHAERLIVEAMRYGDCHRPTMRLANFWLTDKSMIHKLFKELVPRYSNQSNSFTVMHMLGRECEKFGMTLTELKEFRDSGQYLEIVAWPKIVLELRGNNLPPIVRPKLDRSGLLTNILLNSARESRRLEAEKAIAAATGANDH